MPYSRWLPWNAAEHGGSIDNLINIVHWFMAILFVGWGIFFVYCLYRFRRSANPRASYELPKGKVSKYSEIAVGIFEVVVLVGFSMPVWAKYKNDPPPVGRRFEVICIGQQFQWNFHYAGKDGKFGRTKPELINASQGNALGLDDSDPAAKDDIISPELHIPVNADVYVYIRSKDVIHSFDIPVLRVKQDAIPGIEIPVWFKANRTSGEFREAMTKEWAFDARDFAYVQKGLLAARAYPGQDGKPVLKIGDTVTDEAVAQLRAGGLSSIFACPRAATEVVCAQLCGNQHYKMHAPLFIESQADLDHWFQVQTAPPAEGGGEEEFHS